MHTTNSCDAFNKKKPRVIECAVQEGYEGRFVQMFIIFFVVCCHPFRALPYFFDPCGPFWRDADVEAVESLSLPKTALPQWSNIVYARRRASPRRHLRRMTMACYHSSLLRRKREHCDDGVCVGSVDDKHGAALQARTYRERPCTELPR